MPRWLWHDKQNLHLHRLNLRRFAVGASTILTLTCAGGTLLAQANPRETPCWAVIADTTWPRWHTYWDPAVFPVAAVDQVDSLVHAMVPRVEPSPVTILWPPDSALVEPLVNAIETGLRQWANWPEVAEFGLTYGILEESYSVGEIQWASEVLMRGVYGYRSAIIALGDISLPLRGRAAAARLLRRAPPDSISAAAAFRSLCQLSVWTAALAPDPTRVGSYLTLEGDVLLREVTRWLDRNRSRIPARYAPCTSWEECFGEGSFLAEIATKYVGELHLMR